ncbi:MAG: hypothetical protein J5582_10330 [Ruminococcus sp.]|uniref:hypothetical protein n=1 Tax=Ruminococcus sp. TaxID=41978 RepID=UPI0025E0A916|nr:hypothetical protein [Ruminococcus sp.]MBO4866937.1 hypothetical protein [Ruminococcus sp.]
MKKFIAIVCALTLSCSIFASCGKKKSDDKDSKASKTGDSVTTEDETSSKAEEDPAEHTRTKAFYDSLNDKKFKLTMVTSSDMYEDSTTTVEMNGDNYHVDMVEGEMHYEIFVIDGVMYSLNHNYKTYYKDENPNEMYLNVEPGMYTMGIESDYVFVSSETTDDGMICEKYYGPDMFTGLVATSDEDENATIFKYYYNNDSTRPEKIEYSTHDMFQTTKITEFSFEDITIEVPELEGWIDGNDADAAVDDYSVADDTVTEEIAE